MGCCIEDLLPCCIDLAKAAHVGGEESHHGQMLEAEAKLLHEHLQIGKDLHCLRADAVAYQRPGLAVLPEQTAEVVVRSDLDQLAVAESWSGELLGIERCTHGGISAWLEESGILPVGLYPFQMPDAVRAREVFAQTHLCRLLDGVDGSVTSMHVAYYQFMKYAKLRELQQRQVQSVAESPEYSPG